jgi:hypothetical protein
MGRPPTQNQMRKKINKLSEPKNMTNSNFWKRNEIGVILDKCKKLMKFGNPYETKMNFFQKQSDKCLKTIEKKITNLVTDGLPNNNYYT